MAATSSLQFRLHPKNTEAHHRPSISRKISCSILLWLMGLSSSALLVLHYSPNPFTAPPLLLAGSKAQAEGACDLGVGRWARGAAETPRHNNRTCRALLGCPNSRGKKGVDHLDDWRWKPVGCELKRFDAGLFLRMVRGKTMAFVGDSVAWNQFESLLCLLSQVEMPSGGEQYKNRDDRFRTWRFASHDFTLTALSTRFLVRAVESTIDDGSSSPSDVFDLHVDEVDTTWTDKVPSTDIVVVSTGIWFFRRNYLYEAGRLLGCTFCSGPNTTTLSPSFAVGKALRTALRFLSGHGVEATLLRTFSPAHFEGGAWDGRGRCSRTRPAGEAEGSAGVYREINRAQLEEMERMRWENVGRKKRFGSLDVTRAMTKGEDNPWTKGYDGCRHWCLPGPVDLWNDLLLAAMETWR